LILFDETAILMRGHDLGPGCEENGYSMRQSPDEPVSNCGGKANAVKEVVL